MKTKYIAILASLASLAASGFGMAQTAYTTPVGYSTQSLLQGFNAAGLTLQSPTAAAGKFEVVGATSLTDNDIVFAPVASRLYVLEISSGSLAGSIFEIPSANISGGTITIPATVPATNLITLGLTTADTYRLRLVPTLETIFTTTTLTSGGVLNAGLNATGADVVWIPTAAGGYTRYFLHSSSAAFRLAGTTTPTPNVPVVYADGILIEKKGSAAAALTVSGEVKLKGTNSLISQGFNLVGSVAPVGLNLSNAGIDDDITAGLNATGADLVWVQQPNLTYIKYFRRSANGAWRTSTAAVDLTAPQVEAVTLSNGFFIEKKSAGTSTLDLNVPASFNNL